MIKNYIKLAVRNLIKHKGYSFIGIFGLAFGMTFFLLLIVIIQFHQSMDNFHENKDDIYLIYRECGTEHGIEKRANIGAPLAPLLSENLQGIKNTVRFSRFDGIVRCNKNSFSEDVIFADPSLFEVFTFSLAAGNPETALNEPNTVVITQKMAQKYFGKKNPIDKVISFKTNWLNNNIDFKITGVLNKIPGNSHMRFDFLASYATLYSIMNNNFLYNHWDSPTLTYVQLNTNYQPAQMEKLLKGLSEKYINKGGYSSLVLKLKPLKDIYLDTNDLSGFFFRLGGSVTLLITIFTILSSFILLLACINFMNLFTAQATNRAMEVGLRKTIGGQRKQLIMQFLGETLLYSYIAIILAIGLLEVFLPIYNNFTGLELKIYLFNNFSLTVAMIGIATITGLIAGIYPAILISGYQPAKVIKGDITGGSQTRLRKGLIIFQLLISILFIFGTITVFKQVEFLKNKEIGFDKEHVVILPIKDNTIKYKYDAIKHELLKDSRILNVTASSQVPFMNSQNGIQLKSEDIDDVNLGIIYIHFDYLETLKSSLVDGRLPDQMISTDADQAILMNQAACRKLNWQTSVGKNVNLYITEKEKHVPLYSGKIIGIVKDYIFRDFRQPVQPLLFKIDKNRMDYMLIRIDGNQFQSALEAIKNVLYTFAPDQPFDIHFLEDKVEQSYLFFQNFGKMVLFFSFITILLASLGLFGLAIYDTKRRIKEIGVRKIHGASIFQIIGLLSKKYLVLVGIGNILSLPIAYVLMKNMLQVFVYRITVGPDVFLFSIMTSVMIVILSVSWQAIRAATANPVESLRYE